MKLFNNFLAYYDNVWGRQGQGKKYTGGTQIQIFRWECRVQEHSTRIQHPQINMSYNVEKLLKSTLQR